jgi:hypothetical protein
MIRECSVEEGGRPRKFHDSERDPCCLAEGLFGEAPSGRRCSEPYPIRRLTDTPYNRINKPMGQLVALTQVI